MSFTFSPLPSHNPQLHFPFLHSAASSSVPFAQDGDLPCSKVGFRPCPNLLGSCSPVENQCRIEIFCCYKRLIILDQGLEIYLVDPLTYLYAQLPSFAKTPDLRPSTNLSIIPAKKAFCMHPLSTDLSTYLYAQLPSFPFLHSIRREGDLEGLHEGSPLRAKTEVAEAFLVGKDFGGRPAYLFAFYHPDRVSGVITLGTPFLPQGFSTPTYPKGFYLVRWMEPGRAEADFGRFDIKTVVRNIYILFSGSELPVAGEEQEIMDLVDPSTPLPLWFSEEDLSAYVALYEKSGFRFPLQIPYRKIHEVSIAVAYPKVKVPALLVMGEKDYVMKMPGMEDYIRSGQVKHFVPDLEIKYLSEGTHFVQEQSPDLVNELIINFLNKHAK